MSPGRAGASGALALSAATTRKHRQLAERVSRLEAEAVDLRNQVGQVERQPPPDQQAQKILWIHRTPPESFWPGRREFPIRIWMAAAGGRPRSSSSLCLNALHEQGGNRRELPGRLPITGHVDVEYLGLPPKDEHRRR